MTKIQTELTNWQRSVINDIQKGTIDPSEIKKIADDAWYGLAFKEDTLFNPLTNVPMGAHDRFAEYLVWLMTQPEYFSFLIKALLQMETFPAQCLMLKELYTHKFPMLLASRGWGKSSGLGLYALIAMIARPGVKIVLTGAGFRQAKVIFQYMEEIWKKSTMLKSCFTGKSNGPTHGTDVWTFRLGNSITHALPVGHDGSKIRGYRANILLCLDKDTLIQTDRGLIPISKYLEYECYDVLNKNNELETPKKIFKTQKQDVYKITTTNGYSIKCSKHHKLWATNGKESYWKLAKDLTSEDYLELDNNSYFPESYIEVNNTKIDEDMGYLIGLLVSEGNLCSRNKITISHTKSDLIKEIKKRFPYNWKEIYRESYIDKRGWDCKESWELILNDTKFRKTLYDSGLDYVTALDKTIPWVILQSPKSVIIEFLKGLFIGDGSCFKYEDNKNGKVRGGISYYSSSEKLIEQLQILLLKFNVIGCKIKRKSEISINPNFLLKISNYTVEKLYKIINNPYWNKYLKEIFLNNKSNNPRWHKKNKKWIAETTRCNKNCYIGSYETKEEAEKAFENFWENKRPCMKVKKVELLENQEALYDFVMPKSKSFCGGGFINHNCDEFGSVIRQVFEEVMGPFLTVTPNPMESLRHVAGEDFIEKVHDISKNKGLILPKLEDPDLLENQLILSGTAYYKHNHFYEYFKKWRDIITSNGDPEVLDEYIDRDKGETINSINHKNYSILRIPIGLVTKGFMDQDQINRIKSSTSKDVYLRELECVFTDDSDGFYRKSLLDYATITEKNIVLKPVTRYDINSGQHKTEMAQVHAVPMLYGDPKKKYIFGVDPAYQGDNFAIVVLECEPTYRKVVHVWTTQSSDHKQLLKDGVIDEHNYYQYCARKIRNLMKRFPCAYIGLDSQGGGKAIMEALRDESKLEPGENLILPVPDPEKKPTETDHLIGDHILYIMNFTNDWVSEANHAMKKDLELQDLIFPYQDNLNFAMADFYDKTLGEHSTLYDTLEDCILEIQELKNEMTTIQISETPTGKQKFDTPETKIGISKKGRLRKDRYSALLIANYIARFADVLLARRINPDLMSVGGFSGKSTIHNNMEAGYMGNQAIGQKLADLYKNG